MRAVLPAVPCLGLLAVSLASPGHLLGAGKASGARHLASITPEARAEYIRRAAVWHPTRIASMDLMRGPQGKGAFGPDQQVTCDYVTPDKPLEGNTPKFQCAIAPDDVAKVKYGKGNGEVYAEVAASRLLWALGFGAERMYSVQVTCRNCPIEPWFWSSERKVEVTKFEIASIQRKLDGEEIEVAGREGWAWPELDRVDERMGGAPRAQRDALKLLAVFLQHSDSKPDNQRLLCLPDGVVKDGDGNEDCTKPFMYIHDLGVTFGKATLFNNTRVDFEAWQSQPVWKDEQQCVGNQRKSVSGTLEYPVISEAGRKFLADLMVQLSEAQIHDMFAAARIDRIDQKLHAAGGERRVTVDDWVQLFKKKRDEVVNKRCPQ
jgi:hypothetical protein